MNSKKIEYKQRLKNHVFCLIFILALTLFMIIFTFIKNELLNGIAFRIGLVFYLIYLIPVLFIHIEYSIIDFGKRIEIDKKNKLIRIKNKSRSDKIDFDSIELIEIYSDRKGWFSTSSYEYAKIKLKDKSYRYITCLIIRDIENKTHGIDYINKRRIIPSIFLKY